MWVNSGFNSCASTHVTGNLSNFVSGSYKAFHHGQHMICNVNGVVTEVEGEGNIQLQLMNGRKLLLTGVHYILGCSNLISGPKITANHPRWSFCGYANSLDLLQDNKMFGAATISKEFFFSLPKFYHIRMFH